jgi:predicted ATPase/class 3 adenylate cyclase
MPDLPGGTVTFLLTDVEGSTALWEEAPEAMRTALARHDALFEKAVAEHGGVHIRPRGEGDSRFAVFASAPDAVTAALAVQRAYGGEAWPTPRPVKVRIGVHTGEAELRDGDYYGSAVNRCARLRGIGHGGQILLSKATMALVHDALPPAVSLTDLGEHGLKDLTRPERVFQVLDPGLPNEFPPLVSLDARPHNLPLQVTPLLGRDQDVRSVGGLLLREGVRLVTLTGPGGTGKTRLGLQVAADLLDRFDDGVFFVELAPIADPTLVPSVIAQALGVRDVGGRPVLDAIVDYLHGRRLLLLLDNFEQVLTAATVVTELLRACPGLRVLVTSRAPLLIGGEHEYPVPPLALPDAGQSVTAGRLSQYAAVALFVERAVAVKPDFALTEANAPAVAEICMRLDGLPLAIELAAARTRLLSPEAMLPRLGHGLALLTGGRRDVPARQQTLRNAIAWSYDLLSEDEQRLFRRLGVFVGGFTLESADEVASSELRAASNTDLHSQLANHDSILDGLESLVAKNLVKQQSGPEGDPRFTMLETIREYALEQLEASGEAAALRRRHGRYFLVLAERAEPHFLDEEAETWLDLLQREHDNLRAALAWSLDGPGEVEVGVRVAGALSRFWQLHSHLNEGLHWYELALASGDAEPLALRPKVLRGAAWLAHNQGDHGRAETMFREAATLSRDRGDRYGIAMAAGDLGVIMEQHGEYEAATELLAESLALYWEIGDVQGVAARLRGLGSIACAQGDFARATPLLEESLAMCRELGGVFSTGLALGALGLAALYQRRVDQAQTSFEESLVLFRQLKHVYGIAWSLNYLGRLGHLRGEDRQAIAQLSESLQMRRDLADKAGIAGCLEGLAPVALARSEPERAARLFGAASMLREAIAAPLAPAERAIAVADLEDVRAVLGEEAFGSAWAEGQAMTLEQAVAYALEDAEPAGDN